jgi:hypothetical protein
VDVTTKLRKKGTATMRLVVLESPLKGDVVRNERYARDCVLDCLIRGESPIASHLLFPQVLDDATPAERALGMKAGHVWIRACDAVVVYTDLGVSSGMLEGIEYAKVNGKPVEYRYLEKWKQR